MFGSFISHFKLYKWNFIWLVGIFFNKSFDKQNQVHIDKTQREEMRE